MVKCGQRSRQIWNLGPVPVYLLFAVAIELFDPVVTVRTSAEFSEVQSSLYSWVRQNTNQASLASADLLWLTGQEQLHAETSNVSRDIPAISLNERSRVHFPSQQGPEGLISQRYMFFVLFVSWVTVRTIFLRIIHADLMLQCLKISVLARTRMHTRTNPNPSSIGPRNETANIYTYTYV